MKTSYPEIRLEVSDLEFVPDRPYAAIHGCGTIIEGRGTSMRDKMDTHTEVCQWQEPTA